ncbi:MAG: hypothetical protein JO046_03855 [Solirubrobacterales bacterium]|nr:hypothetical protein [Solirubrobacterales bacterium]
MDLLGRDFVLLLAPGGEGWRGAVGAAASELGLPLEHHVIPDQQFPDAYGITGAGAVLVRPDGFVAWRAADGTGASERAAREVLRTLLCRKDEGGR